MPQSFLAQINTTSNLFVARYFELAIENGIDAQALLNEINLAKNEFSDISERIDVKKLSDMMLAIWDKMGDEAMGLGASEIPRGSWWMSCKLAIHEATLGEALKASCRFYKLITKAYRIVISEQDNIVTVTFADYQPAFDPHGLFAEMTLMAWHRFSAWLIAEAIPFQKITLPYPIVPHAKEYHDMFPGKLEFASDELSFSFASKYFTKPVVQNKNTLRVFMSNCPYELFVHPKSDFSLTSEVKGIIEKHLVDGCPTLEDTAILFNMTKRTFIRKLANEGASFQSLKDIVRHDKAVQDLVRTSLTISDIANRVGFSDSTVFSRAFKSWTGISPLEYRNNTDKT